VTAGDDAAQVHQFLKPGRDSYTADDVLDSLLGVSPQATAQPASATIR
jgi:hypothetical protein